MLIFLCAMLIYPEVRAEILYPKMLFQWNDLTWPEAELSQLWSAVISADLNAP